MEDTLLPVAQPEVTQTHGDRLRQEPAPVPELVAVLEGGDGAGRAGNWPGNQVQRGSLMESMTFVRMRRTTAAADPAVLVATRLIDLLGRGRRVAFEHADEDLIVLRVGPGSGQLPDDRWSKQLVAEVTRVLRDRLFAGWAPEVG